MRHNIQSWMAKFWKFNKIVQDNVTWWIKYTRPQSPLHDPILFPFSITPIVIGLFFGPFKRPCSIYNFTLWFHKTLRVFSRSTYSCFLMQLHLRPVKRVSILYNPPKKDNFLGITLEIVFQILTMEIVWIFVGNSVEIQCSYWLQFPYTMDIVW
jgi:hypothetical protein